MAFRCPSCGAEIPLQDIDPEHLVATCHACRRAFNASGDVEALLPSDPMQEPPRPEVAAPGDAIVERAEAPVPAGYRVAATRAGAPLVISIPFSREFRGDGCGMLLWVGIAAAVIVLALEGQMTAESAAGAGTAITLVIALFVLLGVSRTVVEADDAAFVLRAWPVRLRARVRVAAEHVDQLFVTRSARGDAAPVFTLWIQLRDGSQRRLLSSERPDDVLFIEQQVEKRLGIADRRMPGEFRDGHV